MHLVFTRYRFDRLFFHKYEGLIVSMSESYACRVESFVHLLHTVEYDKAQATALSERRGGGGTGFSSLHSSLQAPWHRRRVYCAPPSLSVQGRSKLECVILF